MLISGFLFMYRIGFDLLRHLQSFGRCIRGHEIPALHVFWTIYSVHHFFALKIMKQLSLRFILLNITSLWFKKEQCPLPEFWPTEMYLDARTDFFLLGFLWQKQYSEKFLNGKCMIRDLSELYFIDKYITYMTLVEGNILPTSDDISQYLASSCQKWKYEIINIMDGFQGNP